MEPVFIKWKESIFYCVCGCKDEVAKELPQGAGILDSTMSEGAGEKHLPSVERNGNKIHVQVGSVEHPMTEEHSIEWIFLETKKGGQFAYLEAAGKPAADFEVSNGDEPVAAYAYCNLHGFWKTEIV